MAITITDKVRFDALTGLAPEQKNIFIATNDSLANTFAVEIVNAGTVTGTVKGYFMRPDGVTVILTGSLSGSTASVTLSEACYYYAGHFRLSIQVGDTTVRVAEGTVLKTSGDEIIDESGAYSLAQLTALINSKIDAPAVAGTNGQALFSDGEGGTVWDDVSSQNVAGTLIVGFDQYTLRTGTAGAAGYLTFVKG